MSEHRPTPNDHTRPGIPAGQGHGDGHRVRPGEDTLYWTPPGYRYLCDWFLLARARSDLALKRPAQHALSTKETKKPKSVRDRLRTFAGRHPAHHAVSLAWDPALDALDISVLFVALRNALWLATGAERRVDAAPLALLECAGDFHEPEAVDHLPRLHPRGALRRCGLLVNVSGASTPLLNAQLHPSADALRLAFGDPETRAAIADALPRAPTGAGQEQAPALLVWPPGLSAELDRVAHAARTRHRVLRQTGLFERLPGARGMHVLLHGPPGTGKTLAARTLAERLGRPLRLVHAPDVLSRWLGEGEKSVRSLYRRAARDGAVLCFDEIDGLVMRRETASHSWERSLVDTFLVEMESFEGVAVYTTNLPDLLDGAMERRLGFRLAVPRPGRAERARIWQAHLPDGVPRAADVDPESLAARDLTGGEIQNAVLAALTQASLRDPLVVTAADLEAGIRAATGGRRSAAARARVGFRAR